MLGVKNAVWHVSDDRCLDNRRPISNNIISEKKFFMQAAKAVNVEDKI